MKFITAVLTVFLASTASATDIEMLKHVLNSPEVEAALTGVDIQSIELDSENVSTTWNYNFRFRTSFMQLGTGGPESIACLTDVKLTTRGGFAGTEILTPVVTTECATPAGNQDY